MQEGRQTPREAALKELKGVVTDFEALLKAARQRLGEAQNSRSESEQQAAMQDLQQLEARQTRKLKEISAHFQARTAALERLKSP